MDCCSFIRRRLRDFDGALGDLGVERECAGAFFVGVAEDAEPVELRFADELLQEFKVAERLAGEADDEAGAEGDAGDGGADLVEGLQEDVGAGAALHALEDVRARRAAAARRDICRCCRGCAMVSSSLPVMRLG